MCPADITEPQPPPARPTIDAVHRDIAFGNNYRLELDKLLLTLATALFAFSVTFVPTLRTIASSDYLMAAWASLAVSVAGGVGELYGWERFYLSYRDHDFHGRSGRAARSLITGLRRTARLCQVAGFVAGVGLMAAFYRVNLVNIKLATG